MPIEASCPMCAQLNRFADEHAGKMGRCKSCGKPLPIPGAAQAVARMSDPIPLPDPAPPAPAAGPTRYEYKILTQKDKWFSGKFDPQLLEQALNHYAKQGWRMRGVATASINSLMGGARDELMFVLERAV